MTEKRRIKVFFVHETGVYGQDFKLARLLAKLSLEQVAQKMAKKGWEYYPTKLFRYEKKFKFFLSHNELTDLLSCLDLEQEP